MSSLYKNTNTHYRCKIVPSKTIYLYEEDEELVSASTIDFLLYLVVLINFFRGFVTYHESLKSGSSSETHAVINHCDEV